MQELPVIVQTVRMLILFNKNQLQPLKFDFQAYSVLFLLFNIHSFTFFFNSFHTFHVN